MTMPKRKLTSDNEGHDAHTVQFLDRLAGNFGNAGVRNIYIPSDHVVEDSSGNTHSL